MNNKKLSLTAIATVFLLTGCAVQGQRMQGPSVPYTPVGQQTSGQVVPNPYPLSSQIKSGQMPLPVGEPIKEQSSASNRETIYTYDILGVRLGMTEKEARAALVRYVPNTHYPNEKDLANKPKKLETKDLPTKNPVNGKNVRAGFVIEYTGVGIGGPGGHDFIKVFIHNDRVWGIWRDDLSGRYNYTDARENMLRKYLGARPTISSVNTVIGNSFHGAEGTDISGVELMDGKCNHVGPFVRGNPGSEGINLLANCRTFFKVDYSIHSKSGVRELAGGKAVLADYTIGHQYFASMENQARSSAIEDQKKLGKGNF